MKLTDEQMKELLKDAPKPGYYVHYKGGHYQLLCCGLLEATLEPMVTYRKKSLDGAGDGMTFCRPLKEWNQSVWDGRQYVQRYRFLARE